MAEEGGKGHSTIRSVADGSSIVLAASALPPDAVERIDDVVERIDDVVERIDDVVERIDDPVIAGSKVTGNPPNDTGIMPYQSA
jgi:hypothetical protein